MLESIKNIAIDFWNVLGEMSPYLLFGFFVAGVISVLIRAETVERHLGGKGIWPVVKASAFGVPLPLCSCGVIPVAASLHKHGAGKAATASFLISTPQTGVDSIFVTFSLLGPVYAIFRPVAAFLSGIFGGSMVAIFAGKETSKITSESKCGDDCCSTTKKKGRFQRALRYGFLTLPRDIAKPLLIGLFIAGVISVIVPDDFFAERLGQGITGMLVMLVLGIPVYVCATASVPIAAALIAKGVSPGAALVFLMTGPATNAAGIAMIWKTMGSKTATIYLLSVAVSALVSGFMLNGIITNLGVPHHIHAHSTLPDWFNNVSAVALLGVLYVALFGEKLKSSEKALHAETSGATLLKVTGMTCSHCANAVKKAITVCAGVNSVEVNLSSGTVAIRGNGLDTDCIERSISELGYKVTERRNTGDKE